MKPLLKSSGVPLGTFCATLVSDSWTAARKNPPV